MESQGEPKQLNEADNEWRYFTDYGTPLPESSMKRFMDADLSHLQCPKYKKHDFYFVVKQLRYNGFVGNLDDKQFSNNLPPVGRDVADSAWYQLLVRKYGE